MPYECKHECGYEPGTSQCLLHQLRKLAEEVAEVQEAVGLYPVALITHDDEDVEKLVQETVFFNNMIGEWVDVKTMIEGIEKYHPLFLPDLQ